MDSEDSSDIVWNTLTEPAQQAFIDRRSELTGLVHYTSFSGLEGIIRNEELWFSPVAAMNDFDEVTKGKQMLEDLSKPKEPLHEVVSAIIAKEALIGASFNEAYKASRGDDLFDTFVSCWSTCEIGTDSHDNLTMWRGYASDGNGAAIVIDPMNLGLAQLFASHIVAYPVFYETEKQFVGRAKRSFSHFLKNLSELDSGLLMEHSAHVVSAFVDLCFQLAITHKHPGFQAEREWRFIWRRHGDFDEQFSQYVHLKVGPRGMYEYFCFPIKTNADVAPVDLDIRNLIKEITIGPTEDAYLKMQATASLLRTTGFDLGKTKVTQSNIPFRSTQ